MTKYYFVTASLPQLRLDEEPKMHLDEFLALCERNLSRTDMRHIRKLQQFIDILNFAALWRGQPLNRRGSLTAAELEQEEALTLNHFSPFVFEFLDTYTSASERVHHHGRLVAKFFQEAIAESRGFLQDYFAFERELRLVLVGLRGRQLERDLGEELRWEDSGDPLVAQLLAGQRELPPSFEALAEIFTHTTRNPLELHRQIEFFRFGRVDALVENEIFSLDAILGYMVQLMITERLYEVDMAGRAA